MTAPARRFLLVGLTGGIATGKSTVSDIFKALGAVVIDADQLARDVVAPGTPGLAQIVREFGDVLRPDGSLDRKKAAAIVFADPAKRKRLEAITHPAIRERFLAQLAELEASGFEGIVIWDAPVMIESGGYQAMDRLVVVVTDEATQRARLVARDADAADGERRIASQMPLSEKAKLADYVIDNSGDRAATEEETKWVYESLTRESAIARQLCGSPVPLAALFFRNAENRGANPFDPSIVASRYREIDRSSSWVAYHRARPSAVLVLRDPGRDGWQAAERNGTQATGLGLVCILRPFGDLARLQRALPAAARITRRGKIVVGRAGTERNVVAVLLQSDVGGGLKLIGKLTPKIEALTWTSDHDVICLYDRPASGNNGQVERAVCASLTKRAPGRQEVYGTARAMSVIKDILDGTLGVIDGKHTLRYGGRRS